MINLVGDHVFKILILKHAIFSAIFSLKLRLYAYWGKYRNVACACHESAGNEISSWITSIKDRKFRVNRTSSRKVSTIPEMHRSFSCSQTRVSDGMMQCKYISDGIKMVHSRGSSFLAPKPGSVTGWCQVSISVTGLRCWTAQVSNLLCNLLDRVDAVKHRLCICAYILVI